MPGPDLFLLCRVCSSRIQPPTSFDCFSVISSTSSPPPTPLLDFLFYSIALCSTKSSSATINPHPTPVVWPSQPPTHPPGIFFHFQPPLALGLVWTNRSFPPPCCPPIRLFPQVGPGEALYLPSLWFHQVEQYCEGGWGRDGGKPGGQGPGSGDPSGSGSSSSRWGRRGTEQQPMEQAGQQREGPEDENYVIAVNFW